MVRLAKINGMMVEKNKTKKKRARMILHLERLVVMYYGMSYWERQKWMRRERCNRSDDDRQC